MVSTLFGFHQVYWKLKNHSPPLKNAGANFFLKEFGAFTKYKFIFHIYFIYIYTLCIYSDKQNITNINFFDDDPYLYI